MNPSITVRIIETLWGILILYWILTGFGNKRTKHRQERSQRFTFLAVMVVTVLAMTFYRKSREAFLFPMTPGVEAAGVLICALGVVIAIWARRILGRNWSGLVMIKEDHELIERGPYRWVRHPIYTGLVLAMAGTVLAVKPTQAGVIACVVWVMAFYVKSQQEERLLVGEFGERYLEYRERVKAAILPLVF